MSEHPDHSKQLPRLNRIVGQIEGIKKMIDEKRYCPDIMTQLRAARSALKTIEADMLECHLSCCVTNALSSGSLEDKKQKIVEIKEIFKRYED
jgi:DNA-binding FrmR family transcriptional regulator